MSTEVRILILEYRAIDAALIEHELRGSGIGFRCVQVQTKNAFTSALRELQPDLVLSNNSVPSFDALSALELTRQAHSDAGFIVVSGSIGEELAVQLLTSGATDYVLKSHLAKLAPVALRALAEREQRRESRDAGLALLAANERFRIAFESAVAGMAVIGLDGRLIRVNEALCALLGRAEQDLLASTLPDVVHPLDQERTAGVLRGLLTGNPRGAPIVRRFLHGDGHAVWVLFGVSRLSGADELPVQFVGQFVDVTATKDAEAALMQRSLYDQLTGLPNRTLIDDRLTHALSQRRRTHGRVTVLFIDLDHFNLVNESLGHGAGDIVLVAVAKRLREMVREGDTIGRFGGDEFVLVCDGPDQEPDVTALARRVAETMAAPFEVAGNRLTVTASVGIATASGPRVQAHDVLQDADAAMHRAKELGRARYVVFDDALRARVVSRFSAAAGLRRALDGGELCVYYQPQVAVSSGDLYGFEALVRWRHPERGLVGPNEFVPLAEETGLIVPLGAWVLEQACREAASWRTTRRSPVVSVNVSARQIADPGFGGCVARVLAQTGLDPARLCLEVTESMLVVAAEAMTLATASLRKHGVHVSIDDFGTGYASLNYLVQFRPDALKIDMVFIQGLGRDPMNLAIVTAIVGLARSLGLAVVAEGVETTEQLALLQSLGCDHAQGYLFAKALPAPDARRFLVGAPRS
ncbi:putative bifunctional diguanylate cyclase/phosphodiesterase [Pengzhenrongella sp.]|jgi:diguanylate cyclase (GGDEF)-like protein/PAS domain S-box-containing protein|uniref:putative bifunctional diguanylate cyclase/phosphodiesterase n=1 Tax=Pengzhenrongella sp. TaxID=2888820 RepID=UPI002F9221AE